MEGLILLVIILLVVLPIWLIFRAVSAQSQITALKQKQALLEYQMEALRKQVAAQGAAAPQATTEQPAAEREPEERYWEVPQQPFIEPEPVMPVPQSTEAPPVIPQPEPVFSQVRAETAGASAGEAARETARPPVKEPGLVEKFASSVSAGKFSWEEFFGVKMLMWLGGFAAFLTVVFAIKYSFDRNLITPERRAAAGSLVGVGLLVAGVWINRKKHYVVGSQTLCATGILILYANIFACRSIYRFEMFGAIPSFLLMVLVTATAFVLAVRLNALVVAILGMCGGFLTPVLLSTGVDNPLGLFGYIALLDAGLLAVALRMRWRFLAALGAVGTVILQTGWVAEFFVREHYYIGNKVLIAYGVFFGFALLFSFFHGKWGKDAPEDWFVPGAAMLLGLAGLFFAGYAMKFGTIGQAPGPLFLFILLMDLCFLSLPWTNRALGWLQLVAGGAVFLLLAGWTVQHVSGPVLTWGLAAYFGFAVLHAALPFVLQKREAGFSPLWWAQIFPPVALLLMFLPILKLEASPLVLWPVVLLLDLLVLLVALLSASLVTFGIALVLTLALAGAWLAHMPAQLSLLPEQLFVIGAFAIFFLVASVFAIRWLSAGKRSLWGFEVAEAYAEGTDEAWFEQTLREQLPAFASVLPFILLVLVEMRMPLVNPSQVFGLALLLVVLMLGLTRLFPLSWLPPVGLGCVLILEHAWHFGSFVTQHATIPLLWYIGFGLVFSVFPFLTQKRLENVVIPWAVAALSGPLHFYLVYDVVRRAWPNSYMGLLPLAFAVPSMVSLAYLLKSFPAENPRKVTLLALFGAAALFFITLAFPIQFERQWITLSWALEGVALLWLFHRVPHNGLRLAGLGLLITAFIRLAVNPAVLEYHVRAPQPIWNWYLYAYGIAALCMFAGAWLLAPPRERVMETDARIPLNTLGTILCFLLVNIEIADYFTPAGATALTFEFSGNLARDMTYSIAWGVFALVLVVVGITLRLKAARFAGSGLLAVTLLKVFFHDLANLQALYRVGALLGVAIVAIAASFFYQRFFAGSQASQTEPEAPRVPTPSTKS